MSILNEFGQPLGPAVPAWTPPALPSVGGCKAPTARSSRSTWACTRRICSRPCQETTPTGLTYIMARSMTLLHSKSGRRRHASATTPCSIPCGTTKRGSRVGMASYLRITPGSGTIEVGNIHLGSALKRSRTATEAMFLMMEHAFSLGYRRYEWKCDALNEPSRTAALRLGFTFEGTWRQATIYKERNRDTSWFSITDPDWLRLREGFRRWLDPGNFDSSGRQRRRLQDCILDPA